MRVGYAISHVEVADVLNRLRPAFNVNSLAQAAAIAALEDQAHMRHCVAETVRGMRELRAGYEALGLEYAASAANFLLVRVGAAAAVYQALLREGIIARPVAGYGLGEHLRISVGLPQHNQRLLQALPRHLARA
jgi:histidinol-phosphate aminotransferase